MQRGELDDLVGIWEQWTNNNRVLRHAMELRESTGTVSRELLHQVMVTLNGVMRHCTVDDMAAVSAGRR